ncbi:MAG: DUF3450 family protein [Myxococcota bacterium]
MKTVRFLSVIALGIPLGFGALARAQGDDNLEKLAERLIDMRGEVESLHDDLESQQQAHKSRMSSLAQRTATLEAEIQAKQLQLKKLNKALEEQREKTKAQNEAAAAITPVVKDVAEMITSYVNGGIPFQLSDRVNGAQKIVKDLEANDITAPRALNRLWTLTEDEFRIVKENGLFRQEISVEGDEQLSDVLRLGSMILYFRTSDGKFGYAQPAGDDWSYVVVSGAPAEQIENLFQNFEKQVRTGYYTIPFPPGGNQ